MPNWCSTTAKFSGTPKNIMKFRTVLDEAKKVEQTKWFKENVDFHDLWIGSIALTMGYAVDGMVLDNGYYNDGVIEIIPKINQPEMHGCRGTVEWDKNDVSCEDTFITLNMISAWAPPKDFIEAINSQFDLSSEWIAYEPGCCIFINTDPNTFEEIFVFCTPDEFYYLSSEQELLSIANDEYHMNVHSYEELESKIREVQQPTTKVVGLRR